MKVHEIPVPFSYWSWGEEDGYKPGCTKEVNEEYDGHVDGHETWRETVSYHADEMGLMIITEVHRVSIPGYEDRIFYTRQWRGPDGKEFGKKDLKCKSVRAFSRVLKGWRHPYYLDGELVNQG